MSSAAVLVNGQQPGQQQQQPTRKKNNKKKKNKNKNAAQQQQLEPIVLQKENDVEDIVNDNGGGDFEDEDDDSITVNELLTKYHNDNVNSKNGDNDVKCYNVKQQQVVHHAATREFEESEEFENESFVKANVNVEEEDEEEEEEDEEEEEEEEEEAGEEILGSDNEEQENPKDYCKGGYHAVKIGDLFNQRYHILRKLGWGHFSTVWLSWDLKCLRFVALKIVKSAKHYTEAALDEIKLLQCARDSDQTDDNRFKTVQLLDDFKINGPNGTHVCMVFEVLGNNLLKLIIKSNYHGIPLQNVKIIVKQVLQGLDYLHRKCKIIHTDMKPENVLMCVDEEHVKRLAQEATDWQRYGIKPSGSAISTAPQLIQKVATAPVINSSVNNLNENGTGEGGKLSKKKRKRLRLKEKRFKALLEKTEKQIELAQRENLNLLPVPHNKYDENKRLSKLIELNDDILNIETAAYTQQQATATIASNDSSNVNNSESKQKPIAAAAAAVTEINGVDVSNLNKNQKKRLKKKLKKQQQQQQQPNKEDEEEVSEDVKLESSTTEAAIQENSDDKCAATKAVEEEENKKPMKPNPVTEVISNESELQVKIADLGNACWTYHHFTEDIQTRQYRSLEVILGSGYSTSADIWSLACMAFELATGDYLFEPHSGDNYTRDEDHIAHIIELLGPIPYQIVGCGKYSKEFFTKRGELRHINQLRPWELYEVLREKYEWNPKDAAEFSDFLVPMLSYDINSRATALECLNHAWITGHYPDNYEYLSLKSVFINTSFSRNAASTQAVLLPPNRIKKLSQIPQQYLQLLLNGQNGHIDDEDDDDDEDEDEDDEEDDDEDDDEVEVINANVNLKKRSRNQNHYNNGQNGSAGNVLDDEYDEDDDDDNEVIVAANEYADDGDDDEDYEDVDDDDDDDDDDEGKELKEYLKLKEQKLRYLFCKQQLAMQQQQQQHLVATTNSDNDANSIFFQKQKLPLEVPPHQRLQYGISSWGDDDNEEELANNQDDVDDIHQKSTEILKHLKHLKLYNATAANLQSQQQSLINDNNTQITDDSVDVSSLINEFRQFQQQQHDMNSLKQIKKQQRIVNNNRANKVTRESI